MDVRDALEDDAAAMAALADAPEGVMRGMVHDRAVRVAVEDETVLGFVSYDARREAVYVTELAGDPAVVEPLLEEPRGFAAREDLPVEVVLDADDDARREVVEAAGFERAGDGPRFENTRTVRYRIED